MVAATDAILSLNVGGKKFTSSRSTVCKVCLARTRTASRGCPSEAMPAGCSQAELYYSLMRELQRPLSHRLSRCVGRHQA